MRALARTEAAAIPGRAERADRVARELHDTSNRGWRVSRCSSRRSPGAFTRRRSAARQSLDVARQMLRYSQEEARRSVMDLRSQALESRDLAGALKDLARADDAIPRGTARCRSGSRVRRSRLDASEEHHLLRIGLEALTNALKHGGATASTSCCGSIPIGIDLIVEDNGYGLASRHRATCRAVTSVCTAFASESTNSAACCIFPAAPGAGTRLTVTMPSKRLPSETTAAAALGEPWRTS